MKAYGPNRLAIGARQGAVQGRMAWLSIAGAMAFCAMSTWGAASADDRLGWRVAGSLAALDDPDSTVVLHAIRELGQIRPQPTGLTQRLIQRGGAFPGVDDVQLALAETLGELRDAPDKALPELARLLERNDDMRVQLAAARALQKYGPAARAIRAALLRQLARDGQLGFPAKAIASVGLQDRQDVDALFVALDRPDNMTSVPGAFAAVPAHEREYVVGALLDRIQAGVEVEESVEALTMVGVASTPVLTTLDALRADERVGRWAALAESELIVQAMAQGTSLHEIGESRASAVLDELVHWGHKWERAGVQDQNPYHRSLVRLDAAIPGSTQTISDLVRQIASGRYCARAADLLVAGADATALPDGLEDVLRAHLNGTREPGFAAASGVPVRSVSCALQAMAPFKAAARPLLPEVKRVLERADTFYDVTGMALQTYLVLHPVDATSVRYLERYFTSVLASAGFDDNSSVMGVDGVISAIASVALEADVELRKSTALREALLRATLQRMDAATAALARPARARALARWGPLSLHDALRLVERTYENTESIASLRFWAIYLAGGDRVVVDAARWLGPAGQLGVLALEDQRRAADSFVAVLEHAPPGHTVGAAREKLLQVVLGAPWTEEDAATLSALEKRLRAVDVSAQQKVQQDQLITAVSSQRRALESTAPWWSLVTWGALSLPVHFVVWLVLLVFVYPRSRLVQSLLIWNPILRNVFALWYAQLALVVSPRLRRRLFAPFILDLVADAEIDRLDEVPYFDRIPFARQRRRVVRGGIDQLDTERVRWKDVRAAKLVVIEGASGFGKTHTLRALIRERLAAGRVCVFVAPARESVDILTALRSRLDLGEGATGLLRQLVHLGAIDVFIDGLNEASPTTVAQVTEFLKGARRTPVVVTTQPIDWVAPSHAAVFRILPLQPTDVRDFLVSQWPAVQARAPSREQYIANVDALVSDLDREGSNEVWRTPMDLSLVAALLAGGAKPNIFALRDQAMQAAWARYAELAPGGAFPDEAVQHLAVEVLRSGQVWLLDKQTDSHALAALEEVALVVRRSGEEARWRFRHASVTCYLAAQWHLRGDTLRVDRQQSLENEISNPRYGEAFLNLAAVLAMDAAVSLGR